MSSGSPSKLPSASRSKDYLSRSTEYPYITIALKGLVNSGKSTLFNSIFGKNISKSNIQRETMCQVTLSERSDASADLTELKDHIIEVNSSTKAAIQQNRLQGNNHISMTIPEIGRDVPPIMGFFPRLDHVYYRMIETVGFDDNSTDDMNEAWFRQNTKWLDILLFVTDKEKCMNNRSEQDLLRSTVADLKLCRSQGKIIPLVVIINKVDNIQPADLITMRAQCEDNVRIILAEAELADHPCTYCNVSAMKTLYYRLFMTSNSFEHMDDSGICQLAQLELGREGERLARSSDANDRELLRQKLQESLNRSDAMIGWQEECGVLNIIRVIDNLLNDKALPRLLMGHLHTRISELEKPLVMSSLNELMELLKNILMAYKCYACAFQRLQYTLSDEDAMKLQEIKTKALECFLRHCDHHRLLIDTSSTHLAVMIDRVMSLDKLRQYDETPILSHANPLVPIEQWRMIIHNIIRKTLTSAWGFQLIDPPDSSSSSSMQAGMQSPSRITSSSSSSTSSSTPMNSQSSLRITSILDAEAYHHVIDATITLLSNATMQAYLPYTISKIIIPIIRAITASMSSLSINDLPLILYLEQTLLSIEHHIIDKQLLLDVYLAFIEKKIEIRSSLASLAGYSVSFKELLSLPQNESIRQRYFFEFFPIIHETLPIGDLKWAVNMMKKRELRMMDENHSNSSAYVDEVLNHHALMMEKRFIDIILAMEEDHDMISNNAMVSDQISTTDEGVGAVSNNGEEVSGKPKRQRRR